MENCPITVTNECSRLASIRRISWELPGRSHARAECSCSSLSWPHPQMNKLEDLNIEKKNIHGKGVICLFFYCSRRDFAQKAKSRGGTLVIRAYIKESTYSWNIQSYSQHRQNLDLLEQGPRGIGRLNDDVSIVCARKYERVRMT